MRPQWGSRLALQSVITTAISLGCCPRSTAGLSLSFESGVCFASHPPGFLKAIWRFAPASTCKCAQGAVGFAGWPVAWRTFSMRASGPESLGAKRSGRTDWRRGKGGGRGKKGFRKPPALSEAELAEVQGLEGVQALLSEGIKVIVLAHGKARLFYEGNPVVFGGAVGAVFGEPEAGDKVTVTDHKGKQVGWGFYNPDSMYRVRMLWLNSIDGPADSLRDVYATLVKRLASAGLPHPSLDV